jgi:protein TonB
MPTALLATRAAHPSSEKVGTGFASALALHLAVIAAIGGAAYVAHERDKYGSSIPVAGSIQANMVSSLPLPPRRAIKDSVLASENPSESPRQPPPAPPTPKALATPVPPRAETAPRKDDIPIPKKEDKKPAKPTDHDQPTPSRPRPAPTPPPTPKATTGDTASVQIPAAVSELKNGTASITVEEQAFGQRYAYYVQQISRKVNDSWTQQQVDIANSKGKRMTVTFTIDRAGEPIDPHITTQSGIAALDLAALRTIQRIDTFGPLPAGNNIVVAFSFDVHTQ